MYTKYAKYAKEGSDMKEENDGHITTRVDPALKKTGVTFAKQTERTKAWVFAKAIELGLPEVMKLYPPPKKPKTA